MRAGLIGLQWGWDDGIALKTKAQAALVYDRAASGICVCIEGVEVHGAGAWVDGVGERESARE